MKRILASAKFIALPENVLKDFLVLTPNRAAAARLNVPYRSLRRVAEEILNRERIGIASPLKSLHTLKSVFGKLSPSEASSEAARFRSILSTIMRDGIDITAMQRSGFRSAEKLAAIAEAYVERLWAERLIDADSALWKAGRLIKERQRVLVYGYFRARESDIRFIDMLAGDGSYYVVPSGSEPIFTSVNRAIEWLIDRGWECSERDDSSATAIAHIATRFANGNSDAERMAEGACRALVFPSPNAEVRGTLAAAKKMIVEGTESDRIAIVARKAADYEPTIAAIAEEYGLPVRSQSKTKLAETKLGNYISLVLDAVESDFDFTVTARLVSHAYGPGLSDETWSVARKRRLGGFVAWSAAGIDLSIHARPQKQKLEKWLGWLLKIVSPDLIRERSAANSAELIAYQRFCDAADELRTFEDDQELDFETFSGIIQELLLTVDALINPSRGGIELHQPDSIIGGKFEHVFVIGMAEGILPAMTHEDAVIDFYEQRRLEERGVKFDRPVEFPRWEALSFYYLLLAAKNGVTLSYPKTIETEEKIASPFFNRLGMKPVAYQSEAVASSQEQLKVFLRSKNASIDHPLLRAARHSLDVERRRESAQPGDEYDGVIAISIKPESRVWSASQLTKIGQCPFKWFAERVLKLSPIDEGDTDLRSSVLGRLYHRTLQLAAEKALNSRSVRQTVLNELEPAFFLAETDENNSVTELPNWEHRRGEHLSILKKAVESSDFIEEGSLVFAVEKEFNVKWNGFDIHGKIDRVDQIADGSFKAIDYKTGTYVGKVKDATGELETDIQLPIYSKVALESLHPGKVTEGQYFSLRQTKIIKQKDADLESFAVGVRKILESGNFAVDPDRKKKSCKYCDFDAVCRQGQRNARKPK